MKVGLILNAVSAAGDVRLARRAEEAGFESVYAVEFFNRHAFARLGAVAQATERVGIGSGIANAFTRSPLLHATAALDLDEISGGRFTLGLGSGLQRMNEDWFAVPFSKPASRMRELVELLRALFAVGNGRSFRWQGEFWQMRIPNYVRPSAAREEIPILVAAVNRGMIACAGAVADGMVGHPIHSRRWHREITLPALRDAESAAGRAASACRLLPYVTIALAQDRETAVSEAKRQIGFAFTVEHYHSILDLHGLGAVGAACRAALPTFDVAAMEAAVPDALVDEIAIACTPDEAHDRLALWQDLCDEALLYPATIGLSAQRQEETLDIIFDTFSADGTR